MGTQTGIAALVLAAGLPRKRGGWTRVSPLGSSAVLARAVKSFQDAGVSDVRVVVGHGAEEIIPLLSSLEATVVLTPRRRTGVFSAVLAGVDALRPAVEAFFLLPSDLPLVKPRTIRRLLQARADSEAGIIYPRFMGRRGHPPLISTAYARTVLAGGRPRGMRALLNRFERDAQDLTVSDQGVVTNLSSSAEYDRVVEYVSREDIPTEDECWALLEEFGVSAHIRAHSRRVAGLAGQITDGLNEAGAALNRDLVLAGALLHDLCKGQPDHPIAGAQVLRDMAYPRVAEVVSTHMDDRLNQQPVDEAQVVYLADKLSQGTHVMKLADRRRHTMQRFADRPEVLAAAQRRLRKAEIIQERIEGVLGRSLGQLLPHE